MIFATGLFSIGLLLAAMLCISRIERARAEADRRAVEAGHRQEAQAAELARLGERLRFLKRDFETLSAIREVALIANDDVAFERILDRVLKIVEDLIEASELAIHLVDERAELELRALRRGGRTEFFSERGGTGQARAPLAPLARDAYRLRRTLRRVEDGELEIAVLLYADAEIEGVLLARAPISDRSPDDLDAMEQALEALAKHTALAIRKPTLYDRAVTDGLTGLHTRRHFTSELARGCAVARRSGATFALILLDIDHFKRVNDEHGHVAGDAALVEVAAAIRGAIREGDTAFRYGGEEIAVIAPGADAAAGRALAERLRAAVSARPVPAAPGKRLRVTASFGVAAFSGRPPDPEALIAAADRALYAAKAAGRDCVRTSELELPAGAVEAR